MTKDQIRAIFLANGFEIKEGNTDLKPYVYEAAEALLSASIADTAGAKQHERCPDCFGAGIYPKASVLPEPPDMTCMRCHGRGTIYAPPAPSVADAKCMCSGLGPCEKLSNCRKAPSVADAAGASYDAQDAARYRWLRDRGFKYADVSLGTDCDEENFVEFKPRFHIPEPLGMDYEKSEWTATEIDSSVDAAIAKESGND